MTTGRRERILKDKRLPDTVDRVISVRPGHVRICRERVPEIVVANLARARCDGAVLPEVLPCLSHGDAVLRAFEERDAPLVQSVAADPLIPLITTVPASGALEDALTFIERQHERLATHAGYSFAIADATEDRAVGQIGLWLRDIASGRATTGYWIAPQFRRRGFATSALHALTDWAFTLAEVERVELYVEPWNEGSWRAAERSGYQREGLLRSWQQVGSERRDVLMYSAVHTAH